LKQLILTADDFGRSHEINEAIERYHQAGFLTQASLMVNEPAADEAVRIARRHPALGVGLHLTLCASRAAGVSALTDPRGNFAASPARAGLRYFFRGALRSPLRDEIRGQFERFRDLRFAPTYWDGHAHLHLHPTILALTLPVALEHGFRATRLVREPGVPALLPVVFGMLSRAATPLLKRNGVAFADRVFGLRDTGRMCTETVVRILENLPDGTSELYFHPGAEPEALDFPRLRELVESGGIRLVQSAALSPPPPAAR
jgi:hopanoid biosynthesis associated protein HpnK